MNISKPLLGSITERDSGQILIQSAVVGGQFLKCGICSKQFDNSQHTPYLLCSNGHLACKTCLQAKILKNSNNVKNSSGAKSQVECYKCKQKIDSSVLKQNKFVLQIFQYLKRVSVQARMNQSRNSSIINQLQQRNQRLKQQNSQLRKWIKQVSTKIRQVQTRELWDKGGDKNSFKFVPDYNQKDLEGNNISIVDKRITKKSVGSFTNVVSIVPIPKKGVHSFSVKLVSSLSGGSVVYGICLRQAKKQKFPWLTPYLLGYSGNDGDIISEGKWANMTCLYPDGIKARAGSVVKITADMNNKLIRFQVNGKQAADWMLIPEKMRQKQFYPIVSIQDRDIIQILDDKDK